MYLWLMKTELIYSEYRHETFNNYKNIKTEKRNKLISTYNFNAHK